VRAEQEAQRAGYSALREERARAIVTAGGVGARLRGTDPVLPEVDAKLLRRCTRCEETIYPDPARPRDRDRRCPYCDGRLSAWSGR
jgi:DNA-directed RNA polymerase subunit RPC12/RpoP